MVGMDYHSLHFSGRTMGEPSGQLNSRWKSSELDTGPITLKQQKSLFKTSKQHVQSVLWTQKYQPARVGISRPPRF
jgi:hypothetical protein